MKSARPAKISYRKLISRKTRVDLIPGNIRVGETIVPIGDEEAFIILPEVENTSTYKILKTENLEANLKIACGGNGTFKSLTLRNTGGTLSLEPGVADARLITLNPSLSEASKVDFLSEGNDWYSWGWLVGESLSALETPIYMSPFSNKLDDDNDGLSNSQEAALGTDSSNSDSDGDNVGDGIEVGTGTDPTDSSSSSDPNQDSDGDGFSDFDEILAGTNHLDPTSFQGATESTLPDPSEIGPTFTGIPNNLVIEAGTSEPDAKVQALIGVVANDPQDGNIPISITFSGYDGTHGNTFTATYAATDTDGNTTTVDKTFTVEDTVAPVITLSGVNPLILTLGAIEGNDPGATTDDGSAVTSDFATVIDNNSEVGEYTITYTSTDAAGNVATPVTRTVEVAEASSFIEDIPTVIARNANINTSTGIFEDGSSAPAGGMDIKLDADGILQYNSGEPVNDEFTISWWMNLDSTQASSDSNLTLAGEKVGVVGGTNRNFEIILGNLSGGLSNPYFSIKYHGGSTLNNFDAGVAMGGVWTHVAIRVKNTGSDLRLSVFLNGSELSNAAIKPIGTKFMPPSTHETFLIGGAVNASYNSVTGDFDSIQIGDGIALADAQIAAIAAQVDRQMTIEEASQVDVDPPTITITKNSDSSNIADGDSITLNAGEVFENLYTIDITDNSGEAITPVISPAIDTNTLTDYNAHTITATDSAGNSAQITINVRVIGLWTEKVENPVGAFYEDTNYSPSGITMVDGLSSDRYAIAAEMDGLIVNMAAISTVGDGYEVIVNLRPVDTPISSLGSPNWTNLEESTDCPLMIGFLRQHSTYLFGTGTNIPINQTLSNSREWMAGVFYQTRFSNPAATGAQMAFYSNRTGPSGVERSVDSYLTLDSGISSQVLKDQVRQVKYIITLGIAGKMNFDIYTKLPTEQSWTTLVTGLYHTTKQNLHLAIVGQTYPNGSIVQDVSIQPLN